MKKLIFTFLIMISSEAFAGWSTAVKVTEIIAEGSEDASGFVVVFSAPIGSDVAGETCSGTYHYLNASTEKGKLMFSLLLTAKTSDTGVRVALRQSAHSQRCKVDGVR